MQADNLSRLNVGALIHDGAALTTREVLALLHEVCRYSDGTDFPQTPEDLSVAANGELLIAQSDRSATPMDPPTAIARLLETMLPVDDRDPARTVAPALRGLPARLRTASGAGPNFRQDLMTILSSHLAGDAPKVIQQLQHRVTHAEVETVAAPLTIAAAAAAPPGLTALGPSGVLDDLELYPEQITAPTPANPPLARVTASPTRATPPPARITLPPTRVTPPLTRATPPLARVTPPPTRATPSPAGMQPRPPRTGRMPWRGIVTALAVGALFVAIGAAPYWLVRNRAEQVEDQRFTAELREPPSVPAAGRVVTAPRKTTGAAPAAIIVNPTAPAGAVDARPAPLPLPVVGGAFSPAFATGGRELFFHAGPSNAGRLFVASLDNSGQAPRVRALLDERARNYHPRLSPDGRRLAFDSDRDGERGVYVSDRDGANPQRVSGEGYGAVPSWSPDMKRLAFIRGEAARPQVWNLWLRDLSSGAVQRHTSFRSGQIWGASWFPDGRSLCYSHGSQLVISHLDARQDIVIDTPRRGQLVRTPAVSPDGGRVVFQVFKDGVWLLDVQTRQMQRILDDPSAEEFSWTPDGRRIAYHSRRDGTWKIWIMNAPKS